MAIYLLWRTVVRPLLIAVIGNWVGLLTTLGILGFLAYTGQLVPLGESLLAAGADLLDGFLRWLANELLGQYL